MYPRAEEIVAVWEEMSEVLLGRLDALTEEDLVAPPVARVPSTDATLRGAIGYFSTYSLGNVISLQIWERVLEELPDVYDSIERGECQVRNQHADDDHQREEHEERPGEIHVLALERGEEHRAGRRQRQHNGGDLRARDDVRQQAADVRDEEVERHAQRVFA